MELPAPPASRAPVRSSKRTPTEAESPAGPASHGPGRSSKRRPTETDSPAVQASRGSARLMKRRAEVAAESESLANPGSSVPSDPAKKIPVEIELPPDPPSRVSARSAKRRTKTESLADQGPGKSARSAKKRLTETEMQADPGSACVSKREALVGSYVEKEPPSGTGRTLLGKIMSYKGPKARGVFRVVYEDGESENLGYRKLSKILMKDEGVSGVRMRIRKRKLDQLAPTLVAELPPTMKVAESAPEAPHDSQAASEDAVDAEDEEDVGVEEEDVGVEEEVDSADELVVPQPEILPPMPELPPSSGDIAVPEESISYLFSVYNFVRSFSRQLFLSPFSLDEFVGALNCNMQNSLLDAVHFSLMRSLKPHLETVSAEESNFASKCLRCYDWTLLDPLTWPVFLVEYLYLTGYMKKMDKEDVSKLVARSDYYALPVGTKLKILQMLCDDILDVAELRAELEMRESMEVEKECDVGDGVPPESIALRKGSRYSKTTTSKDSEDAEPDKGSTDVKAANPDEDAKECDVSNTVPPESILMPKFSETSVSKDSETMVTSSEPNKLSTDVKVIKLDEDVMDSAPDGNSDECCLCGMDGTLVCCDGCPSAYHSRCISLNKVPEGLWYCPECSVNKLGQTTLRIGRGVRGAEDFGIDPYGRMFQGTCNYLLVTGMSVNVEPIYRYYNQDDVTKVLSIISKGENLPVHIGICRRISKYWEIPLINTQAGKTESVTNLQLDKDPAVQCSTDNFKDVEEESQMNNIAESSADNREILSQNNDQIILKVAGSALDLVVGQASLPDSENHDKAKHATSTQNISEVANDTSLPQKDDQFVNRDATGAVQKSLPFLQNNSSFVGNGSAVSNVSNLSQPISVERSSLLDIATSGSANATGVCCEEAGGLLSKKYDSASISDESKQGMHIFIEKCRTSEKEPSLSFFKPQAYVNLYIQGDIAASAAANLALLASEDNRAPRAQVNYNSRKLAAAAAALQMKAFSGLAMHFLWPSYEKKLMEVPREKCGWCYACRCTYKRACLLNTATSNAMKVSARNISGFRPIKYNGSHLPIIAAHVGNMEETLQGLVIGPFLNAGYIQHWRKRVRGACGFRMLKTLLLELESNIRGIVFSGDWIKLVDDWASGFSGATTGVSRSGLNPKRGPGRRGRKQVPASASVKVSPSNGKKFKWWRGGKLSKTIFQKGALHSSLSKKAARQGGQKRLPGITYPEGSEPIRRSRQLAWRASVQMSKNASQLALQVRYLDAHIRWRDLVPPDQSSSEGKGSDCDSAFRNAVICDKKIDTNQILYALTFENQKHLPVRLAKIIFETESVAQGENDKLWFTEDNIPLYLIKQYEQKDCKKSSPSTPATPHNLLSSWRKRKSRGKDIFLYLVDKRDKPTNGLCVSCQGDLLFRDAVTCKKCQGLCHKNCSVPSSVDKEDDLEFLFTCNICYAKPSTPVNRPKEASNAQIPLQMQNQQNTGMKCRLKIGDGLHLKPVAGGQLPPRVQGTELATMKPPTLGGQQPPRVTIKPPTLGAQPPLLGQGRQLATMKPPTLGGQQPPRITIKPPTLGAQQPLLGQGTRLITIKPPTHPFGPHLTSQANKTVASPEMMSPVSDSNSKRKGKREASQREPKREKNQTFGLIWRKPHLSQSGESFRQQHIILRSKMGQQSVRGPGPTCVLCKVPYSSDLMYVRCEACSDWYHADALNLEEAQLGELLGFKCPKCRKTVRARCPYASDQINKKRKMEPSEQRTKKAKEMATSSLSKVENPPHLFNSLGESEPFKGVVEMETQRNGSASVLERQQEFNIPASSFEMEDLVVSDSVDPLLPVGRVMDPLLPVGRVVDPLLPVGRVQPIEPVPEFNGLETVSQGQQKLTVRRAQVKPETSNASYDTEDGYSRSAEFSEILPVTGNGDDANNFSAFDNASYLGAPDTDHAAWDNYEEMKFDDVEYGPQANRQDVEFGPQANGQDGYEPHTYFSFSELLASEDDEIDSQYHMPTDMLGNQLSLTGGASFQDPLSGTYADGATFGWDVCGICNNSYPSPDLTCQICEMHVHSHCSPWPESEGSSGSAQWRCGNCRDWQ